MLLLPSVINVSLPTFFSKKVGSGKSPLEQVAVSVDLKAGDTHNEALIH
jgi:hypothetical protein